MMVVLDIKSHYEIPEPDAEDEQTREEQVPEAEVDQHVALKKN